MIAQSLYQRNKGQAAALDLAVFVAISVLALSWLAIQSMKAGASEIFVQENENVNEVAIRSLNALAQSSASGFVIKTVQPLSMQPVDSCLSEDLRTIMGYADSSITELAELEQEIKSGGFFDISGNPYIAYFEARLGDIDAYLKKAEDLLSEEVGELLSEADSELASVCEAIGYLSQLLPGYEDMEMSCGEGVSHLFDGLLANLTDARGLVQQFGQDFEDMLDDLESQASGVLLEAVHQIRCAVMNVKETAESFLTYLEAGLNTGVSLLELWPVEAKVKGMTIEQVLSDSVTAGRSFAFADDPRSIGAMAAFFYVRNDSISNSFLDTDLNAGNLDSGTYRNQTEDVRLSPYNPLESVSNRIAEGPYQTLRFGVESYVTNSGSLAVRLKFIGDEIGGLKQKTEYFEGMDYILNSSVYPGNTHHRTYNGSSVKGVVNEALVAKAERSWTEERQITPEITANVIITEYSLLRPMSADTYLIYENLTWPPAIYSFDINHTRRCEESEYDINSSDCNSSDPDAMKSVLLGAILSGRSDLKGGLRDAIKERLDELLKGYHYSFEARDCCVVIVEINGDDEPIGRAGFAKRYFEGGGYRGEMRLTVWRE